MIMERKPIDAVFEGGGVKGIALVGAVSAIENDYEIIYHAGTSAGAIVAALLAAGYDAAGVKQKINALDFNKIEDGSLIEKIPFVGPILDELSKMGLYKGDFFLKTMREYLAERGVSTFRSFRRPEEELQGLTEGEKDRYRYKLQMVAADISRGCRLTLPQDIADYEDEHGNTMKPENLEVAQAVRMSMSIPFFFQPIKLKEKEGHKECLIVDGGLLSNFPVDLFDPKEKEPVRPTLGFKLSMDDPENHIKMAAVEHMIAGPISELLALFWTANEAPDRYYLKNADYIRTIFIDAHAIQSTNFALTQQDKDNLFNYGLQAATIFMKGDANHPAFNYNAYMEMHRSGTPWPSRREMVWRSY